MYTRQTYYQPSTITIAYDAHGALGGASTWARGGNFSIGFASGAVASSITSCTEDLVGKLPTGWKITCMVAAGGLSGGVTASMAGGSFWEGVCNGLICSGLNHALHMIAGPDDPPSPEAKQGKISYKRLSGKKYFWALKHHYLEGHGEDVFLTKEQFIDVLSHGRIDYDNAELGADGYYTALISFYDTNNDLKNSFGVATIKYKILDDNSIKFSAFKDTYNFDPKPWGVRSVKSETITRTYNAITNGTSFSIYYNKVLF